MKEFELFTLCTMTVFVWNCPKKLPFFPYNAWSFCRSKMVSDKSNNLGSQKHFLFMGPKAKLGREMSFFAPLQKVKVQSKPFWTYRKSWIGIYRVVHQWWINYPETYGNLRKPAAEVSSRFPIFLLVQKNPIVLLIKTSK